MNRNIIIIDDFHPNPDEIRQFALNATFPEPYDGYTYPGKNSDENYYPPELHQAFERLLGKQLQPAPNNGYFRLSYEKDEFLQDIHVDPTWEYGAVCYLSDPRMNLDEGGTSFWIHNQTQQDTCPTTDEAAQIWGHPTAKEAWHETVYGEGLKRENWTRYLLSGMKYNRIVIFKADLWHSHNYNFGDNLQNGRMVQLFFFNPTGWSV